MTDKQYEQAKKSLKEEMNAKGFGWINGKYIKPPQKYKIRETELSCISMINSILCYSCEGYKDAKTVIEHEESSYHNYLEEYIKLLGRDRVIDLIQDQINSIGYVRSCVHTDSEGVSYNSIVWADEQ